MRKDNLTWHEMFFGIAKVTALLSKDNSTVNGAVIVNKHNRIIGVGYNGMPDGLYDTEEFWQKPLKYNYVIHAEDNAILNSTADTNGASLYLWSSKNYLPCKSCADYIGRAGINKVYLLEEPEQNEVYNWDESREILNTYGVEIIFVKIRNLQEILLSL